MMKEKLKAAVKELKNVYETVVARPGGPEGTIDLALRPAGLLGADDNFAYLPILAANGLQAHGFVFSEQVPTLFLRNVTEIAEGEKPALESKGDIEVAPAAETKPKSPRSKV